MSEGHLPLEALAQLADGTLGGTEALAAREHLARCRSCMASYVDAVRYRSAWLVDSSGFDLGSSDQSFTVGTPAESVPLLGRPPRRWLMPIVAGGAAAALLVSVGLTNRGASRRTTLRLDPVVVEVLSQSTDQGLLLPGVEHVTGRIGVERGSGSASSSVSLERVLKSSLAAYERSGTNPEDCARLVAALLANGEIETAGDYAKEGLTAHPDAVALLVYAAEARHRASDTDGAEQLLARAARRAPRDPLVALDLGLVLRQQGRESEARRLLERAARSPDIGIATRAKRELPGD